MLLTQKPQPISFSRHPHHRRHPASLSSIAVVPHPTSTPGLLSLTKPPRPTSRHPQRPHSPRFPRNRLHRPTASVSAPSTTLSPSDPARGRSQHPPKAKSPQLTSASHPPTLPNTPVPAVPESPQPPPPAERLSPQPPTLVTHPTGRLARSRRSRHRSTPAVAKSCPSPEPIKGTRAPSPAKSFEPSAPIPVPERRRSERRRKNRVKPNPDAANLPLAEWDFPAPGSSDDGEPEEDEPVTPIGQTGRNHPAWRSVLQEGPKSAPLPPSAARGQFPFFTFPKPASLPRARTPAPNAISGPTTPSRQVNPAHRRVPSQPASFTRGGAVDAMFHLSEDEAEALPEGAVVHQKMVRLFGNGSSLGPGSPLFPSTGTPSPSPRRQKGPRDRYVLSRSGSAGTGSDVGGLCSMDGARQLFASSSFQLAPEPVELPKPSFLLGVRA
ncbi:hypothetical protein JB92DRAFT_1842421 [Gautieria morchelliformis]|nr:hypothetical protein JB92DRAFT_1842421 [Gautieria morchelliformis]